MSRSYQSELAGQIAASTARREILPISLGLGRTRILASALELALAQGGGRALVLTERSLIPRWAGELDRFTSLLWAECVDGRPRPEQVNLVTVDRLRSATSFSRRGQSSPFHDEAWELLVCDWAGCARARESKRHYLSRELSRLAKRSWFADCLALEPCRAQELSALGRLLRDFRPVTIPSWALEPLPLVFAPPLRPSGLAEAL